MAGIKTTLTQLTDAPQPITVIVAAGTSASLRPVAGAPVTRIAPQVVVVTTVSPIGARGPKGDPEFVETSPALTYTSGLLTRIDYDSGNHKTFAYVAGRLHQIVYHRGTDSITKTFVYDVDGNLTSIEQT